MVDVDQCEPPHATTGMGKRARLLFRLLLRLPLTLPLDPKERQMVPYQEDITIPTFICFQVIESFMT